MRGCGARTLLMGLVAILFGAGYILFWSQVAGGSKAWVEALRPLSAAEVRASAPGSEVLVEGVISARNETLRNALVAYVRRSSIEMGDSVSWIDEEHTAPPLVLELADGEVRLEQGYRLVKTEPGIGYSGSRNYSYSGFRQGSRVVAVGRVTQAGTIDAEMLYGGTRSAYIWDQRGRLFGSYVGGCCAILIGLLMVVGSIGAIRARRRQPTL